MIIHGTKMIFRSRAAIESFRAYFDESPPLAGLSLLLILMALRLKLNQQVKAKSSGVILFKEESLYLQYISLV